MDAALNYLNNANLMLMNFDEETDFVEIGEITNTGTCNSYIIDSQNNFVMGDMAGELSKYCA